jgi:hypothetical protein
MIEAEIAKERSGEFTMRGLIEVMGHSSINITMGLYGHLLPGGGERIAESDQALWDRADGPAGVVWAATLPRGGPTGGGSSETESPFPGERSALGWAPWSWA